jgi:hypothetical protein
VSFFVEDYIGNIEYFVESIFHRGMFSCDFKAIEHFIVISMLNLNLEEHVKVRKKIICLTLGLQEAGKYSILPKLVLRNKLHWIICFFTVKNNY